MKLINCNVLEYNYCCIGYNDIYDKSEAFDMFTDIKVTYDIRYVENILYFEWDAIDNEVVVLNLIQHKLLDRELALAKGYISQEYLDRYE